MRNSPDSAFFRFMNASLMQILCRLILGGIFIYASLSKIADPAAFGQAIANYKILPPFLVPMAALTLPWIELLCGTLLILGIFTRTTAIMLSSLMGMFILALSVNLVRGLYFDCGCFSSEISKVSKGEMYLFILRDLAMILPGLLIIIFHRQPKWCLENLIKK